jgi:hypothetical protein
MPDTAKKSLCFVVGPIGEAGSDARTHADWLLGGIIKPVFAEHFPSFVVQRADEIKAPGDINSQVINRLMDAELVIADMSLHNANAFYELAVRHMMRLPTIHMILKSSRIPFDVAPYRAIHFSREQFADLTSARSELESVVREVIAPGFETENPITHARAKFEVDTHATPAAKAVAAEMATLRETVDDLRARVTTMAAYISTRDGSPATDSRNLLVRALMETNSNSDLSVAGSARRSKTNGLLSELFKDDEFP